MDTSRQARWEHSENTPALQDELQMRLAESQYCCENSVELQPVIILTFKAHQHCKMSRKRAWPVVALFAASRGSHLVVYSRSPRKSIVRAWCMPVALTELLFSHQVRIWPLV